VTRPSFSVSIPDRLVISAPNGTGATEHWVTAKFGMEDVTGVSRRKPQGFLAPTAYYFKKVHTLYQRGSCTLRAPDWIDPTGSLGIMYVGQVGSSQSPAPVGDAQFGTFPEYDLVNDEGLRNAALIAVRSRLKRSHVNLGVAYGERKKTAQLLGETATRLARSARALKRGQIRKAMRELGIAGKRREPRGATVPQKWLELQYGWKPLLSDVYGAAKALENRPKGDWRVTAKATRSLKDQKVVTFAGQFMSRSSASWSKSVFARIDALPQNEAIISLASLGALNPLSVAWELVPFSFVADWFIPIGGFIDSLDAMLGYGESFYSSTLLTKAVVKSKGLSGIVYGSWPVVNDFVGTKRMVLMVREVSTSVPLPVLPGFKDPRSLGHMANGLALIASVFGGKSSKTFR